MGDHLTSERVLQILRDEMKTQKAEIEKVQTINERLQNQNQILMKIAKLQEDHEIREKRMLLDILAKAYQVLPSKPENAGTCGWDNDEDFQLKCASLRPEHAGKYLGNHASVERFLRKTDPEQLTRLTEEDCLSINGMYGAQIVALIRHERWGGDVEMLPGATTLFWEGDRVVYAIAIGLGQQALDSIIVEQNSTNVTVTKTLKITPMGGLQDHFNKHIIGSMTTDGLGEDQGALDWRNLTGGGSIHRVFRGETHFDFPPPNMVKHILIFLHLTWSCTSMTSCT
jgi:hypothetical protein